MLRRIRKEKNRRERGMELLEMALILPLLLVFTAGVIDFGNAWHIRQILVNAAREGARLGATQPMLDLDTSNPQTVQEICQDVADYLSREAINTSFMNGTSTNPAAGCASPTVIADQGSTVANPVPLGWTYYSSGAYGLKIQRTVLVTSLSGGTSSGVSSTQVTLDFPFSWPFGFNKLIGGGGVDYTRPIAIKVNSIMANTD